MTAHARIASLSLLLVMTSVADARMYEWVNGSSGSVQLSGEPPPWYRSEQGGPRVRVFENGNLVDDTAIALPRAQSESLRSEAFREAEARQRAEALKRLEQAARREELRRQESERLARAREEREQTDARDAAASGRGASSRDAAAGDAAALDDATVERLKAIIAEFDRRGGGLPEK